MLLWLDGLHLGPQTLNFVDFLFDHLHTPPVFVLATADAGPPSEAEETYERLRGLTEHPTIDHLIVQPLSETQERQLADHILPLDDSRAPLLNRTDGRPLFPEHTLYAKAARGELEPSGDRWRLTDNSGASLSMSLEQLWRRRVDSAVQTCRVSDRADAHCALRLAAVLGQRILADEWQAVCEAESARETARTLLEHAEQHQHRPMQAAAVHLEELPEKLPELGWNVFLAHVHLGLAVCSAAAANWDRFEIRVNSAESMLDTFEARDLDHLRLAKRAGDLCLEADRPDYAAYMFDLSRRLWESLGADAEVERLEAQLDDPTDTPAEMSG